jgi:hypothetical protein
VVIITHHTLGHVVSSAAASVNCFFLILGCFLNRYAGMEAVHGAYKKVVVRTIYVYDGAHAGK